jgi:hypothetical protein
MFKLNETTIHNCVLKAVPHIHSHILTKMASNNGFSDNPKAVDPLTKILTLGLDSQTRFDIERELIAASRIDYEAALSQIKFIRFCMESISLETVEEMVKDKDEASEIWSLLNDTCYRDGTIFLRFISDSDFNDGGLCKSFVENMGVIWGKFKNE